MAKKRAFIIFIIFCVIIAWAGIFLQFYTGIYSYLAKERSLGGALIELLSFFTIQSNILVALTFSVVAASNALGDSFFKRPGVQTSFAVNISIVCLVYNLVLRQTYHPVGLARVGDEIVHVAVPFIYILYWLIAVPKNNISWRDGFTWLIYPFGYLIYIMIRGAITGLYPYFFLNAAQFGYEKVMVNIAVLILVFLITGMLYVLIARLIRRYFSA